MARQFFVVPDTETLYLFPDEYPDMTAGPQIEVKRKLTYLEEQMLNSASLTTVNFNANRAEDGDTEIGLDMARHAILRLATWIVEWNLTDHTGKPMPLTRTNIQNLDPDTAREMVRVLDEHVASLEGNALPRLMALDSATT
jgi:hypothetical protein